MCSLTLSRMNGNNQGLTIKELRYSLANPFTFSSNHVEGSLRSENILLLNSSKASIITILNNSSFPQK